MKKDRPEIPSGSAYLKADVMKGTLFAKQEISPVPFHLARPMWRAQPLCHGGTKGQGVRATLCHDAPEDYLLSHGRPEGRAGNGTWLAGRGERQLHKIGYPLTANPGGQEAVSCQKHFDLKQQTGSPSQPHLQQMYMKRCMEWCCATPAGYERSWHQES